VSALNANGSEAPLGNDKNRENGNAPGNKGCPDFNAFCGKFTNLL